MVRRPESKEANMAPTKTKTKTESTSIEIEAPHSGRLTFTILGVTPLIYNAMSMKSKIQLLAPPPKKNATERLSTLKHNPIEEFRGSMYRYREDDRPTRLYFPGGGVKAALKSAALRLPGLKKTEVAQLTWIDNRDIDIYGIPELHMAVVRSADINRTPDVRTRAALREWCSQVTITYVRPQLTEKSVVNLIGAAGMLCGLGDGRQEKGYGHGQFEIVADNDPRVIALKKRAGITAQDVAIESPNFYDIEAEELYRAHEEYVRGMSDRLRKPAAAEVAEELEEA
jgi:hypothetical protein